MNHGTMRSFTGRLVGAAALVGAVVIGSGQTAAATVSQLDPAVLTPARAATVYAAKCPPPQMSTAGIECNGFAGREILGDSSIFVVGYENNADLKEKFVYQAAATFDLGPARDAVANGKVARASLSYGENSTTRRSAAGDSEYGILPTCNTKLGVPTAPWSGATDKLLQTSPADTAGVAGATTGDSGAWDVTPQVAKWLKASGGQGTFVLQAEDESMDVKAQSMCLSYVSDLTLTVEPAPAE
jgi:hypothetical protein